jgi:hypothetical protein
MQFVGEPNERGDDDLLVPDVFQPAFFSHV